MGYKKNTLCWECRNFSKCSWSKGKPVEGWVAKPTTIKNGNYPDIETFLVLECPKFIPEKFSSYSYKEIGEIIGKGREYVATLLSKNPYELEKLLREKGFSLKRFVGNAGWHLEKIDNVE